MHWNLHLTIPSAKRSHRAASTTLRATADVCGSTMRNHLAITLTTALLPLEDVGAIRIDPKTEERTD